MLHTDLLIGATGWENENWVGGFYPEDLPGDWRFGYYTNRLRSVLVPAAAWSAADIEPLVTTMLEDLYPEFRMVLEWELNGKENDLAATQEFLEKSRPVDANVDAYLVKVPGTATESALQGIDLLQQQHPVCLKTIHAQVDEKFLALSGVSLCWMTDTQARPVSRGQFLVALSGNTEPRGIREIIEKIDAWPEGHPSAQGAALYFINDKAAETAFQARTIAELMGV